MTENFRICDFELNCSEMAAIATLGGAVDPVCNDQDLAATQFICTLRLHDYEPPG